jgi:hypothetical protein
MLCSLTVTPYQELSYLNKRKSLNVVGSYIFLLSSLPPLFLVQYVADKIPEIDCTFLSEFWKKLANYSGKIVVR